MSQTCNRCYKIVHRACQNDTEAQDCRKLYGSTPSERVFAHLASLERANRKVDQ